MEVKTRLASWSNFTEFKQLWWSVVDVVREEELDINKPRVTYHMAEVPASPSQLAFFEHIVGRANQVRERLVDPKADNYPKITSDVKRGVIHPLLLRSSELKLFLDKETIAGLRHEHTKVSQSTEDTYQEWLKYKEQRLTQLLFLDSGTPNNEGRFTAYALIKAALIARGVPAEEIAYAHDAHSDEQKADLFRRFRQGLVRILIGSTKRLGVGSHFPDRLRVVRCIDVPMRPADILQRIGRMVRPGNQNTEVEVWNYLTVGKPYTTAEGTVAGLSPDAYFFNVVQTKARFIDAMDDESDERVVQDIDEVGSLNFGLLVATASGDPRFKRKVELDTQVERLLSEEQDWQTQRIFLERRIHNLQQQVESGQKVLEKAKDAASRVVSTQGKQFKITLTLNGKTHTYTKRETAGEVLMLIADQCRQQNSEDIVWVGELSSFAVGVNAELDSDRCTLFLDTPSRTYMAFAATPLGACRSLEEKLKAVLEEPETIQAELDRDQEELTRSLDLQATPFALENELKAVLAEQEALNRELGIKEEEPLDAVAAA